MALVPGTRLGAYEIVALIGRGGMGEVYRVKDIRLGREVAIKTLPDAFAHDAGRIARFNREAQLLASLNHPHVGAIYGLEEVHGQTFLVLELIEGETLAGRIRKGRIPLDEALAIARQITEALKAAHDKGIVHRDLKPANIAVAADGTVKVLDFGLAKGVDASMPADDLTHSPTISPAVVTGVGVVLGTAAYLSPEQAKGRPADQRSDLWSFGCVLFEMLTGRRTFSGATGTDVIAAIVRDDPDWDALPDSTPAPIRRLLRRCLEKDRHRRLTDASDARLEIDDAIESPTLEPAVPLRRIAPRVLAALTGAAVVGTLATFVVVRLAEETPQTQTRFAIIPPAALPLGNPGVERDFIISPEGRYIVYRSSPGRGGGQLAVRRMDQLEPSMLEGIVNAREPFFSADGRSIGFFDGDELKRVSLAGGPPVTICEVKGMPVGATWGDDNTIVFATNDTSAGLWRVSAQGGKPTLLTKPDAAQHEASHMYPWMLPESRGVLFTVVTDRLESSQVAVLDLRTGQRKTLIKGGTDAKLVEASTGSFWRTPARSESYLVYASASTLRAVVFDLDKFEPVGEPVAVVDDILVRGPGAAEYAVSRSGTLVYAPAASDPQRAPRSLIWVDKSGREEPIKAPPRAYGTPRVSPDGSRILLDIDDRLTDLWVWDLARETLTRVTSGGAIYPIWTRDGRRIVFSSQRGRAITQDMFVRNADGAGIEAQLTASDVSEIPTAVTADGKYVVGWEFGKKTQRDITLIPLATAAAALATGSPGGAAPAQITKIVQSPFNELGGELSPDGRYLAYQSDESGRFEVYVRPFPQVNAGRWQISTSGGTMPVWAPNGQELFYLDGEGLLATVPTRVSGPVFAAGKPTRVLQKKYAIPRGMIRSYDVSPDGRFVMQKASGSDPRVTQARMVVVTNWMEELKQHVPTR